MSDPMKSIKMVDSMTKKMSPEYGQGSLCLLHYCDVLFQTTVAVSYDEVLDKNAPNDKAKLKQRKK